MITNQIALNDSEVIICFMTDPSQNADGWLKSNRKTVEKKPHAHSSKPTNNKLNHFHWTVVIM